MENPLIAIVVIVIVAAIISYIVQAFVPIEARIKQLVLLVLWGLVLIAILIRFIPILGLGTI